MGKAEWHLISGCISQDFFGTLPLPHQLVQKEFMMCTYTIMEILILQVNL